MLKLDRLQEILAGFTNLKVLVIGDFYLDQYLDIDGNLWETSLETGLRAYQVVDIRNNPGAAGSLATNLKALDATPQIIGVCGGDGRGFDLRDALERWGVDPGGLIEVPGLFTPTYTKLILHDTEGSGREIERLDIKNRSPFPLHVEEQIIARLHAAIEMVDGVLVVDQAEGSGAGVCTPVIRNALSEVAKEYPEKLFMVESRRQIGKYQGLIIKPNRREALIACGYTHDEGFNAGAGEICAVELHKRTGASVILTQGKEAVIVVEEGRLYHVPSLRVDEPLDIVGAGISLMAGTGAALCCGASLEQAVEIGVLVASITIQQLGTTGTATRDQVLARWKQVKEQDHEQELP